MHMICKEDDKPHKNSVAHISLKIVGVQRIGKCRHIPSEVKENLLHVVLSASITKTRMMLSESLDLGGDIRIIISATLTHFLCNPLDYQFLIDFDKRKNLHQAGLQFKHLFHMSTWIK